ncbi:MAG: TlpA family protein disulfide reductase [Acidobacteriia bacterium]|nr:TlpA family protein disulfide reductase [Terriglobia bacterium]
MRRTFLLLMLASTLPISSGSLAQQKRSLPEVNAAGLKKAVAEQKGKVLFVNFWATWCAPCVAEFPDIVKLYKKYHARGLEVIAVSFDTEAPVAIPFLDRQKADFINLLKSPKQDDDAFINGFDKQWLGALPATWLFDQNGKLVFYVMGKFDPVALDRQIATLLAHG